MLDADLIRHAYILPEFQRHGVGGILIEHLRRQSAGRMLVGTWADASWGDRVLSTPRFRAGDFVGKEGRAAQDVLTISDRQIETSVVLELNRIGRDGEI